MEEEKAYQQAYDELAAQFNAGVKAHNDLADFCKSVEMERDRYSQGITQAIGYLDAIGYDPDNASGYVASALQTLREALDGPQS